MPGAGGQPGVFQGATYVESPVYAWGAIGSAGGTIGTANYGIIAVQPLWPAFTPNVGTYLITISPEDPHGNTLPDFSQCSVTVTVLNNMTSDFTSAPPQPPHAMAATSQEQSMAVPDSVIKMVNGGRSMFGADSGTGGSATASTSAPRANAAPQESNCGWATASQLGITIMGVTYPNSFIVRTYDGAVANNPCHQDARAFFFKVCHR